jgi:hypothetical protein
MATAPHGQPVRHSSHCMCDHTSSIGRLYQLAVVGRYRSQYHMWYRPIKSFPLIGWYHIYIDYFIISYLWYRPIKLFSLVGLYHIYINYFILSYQRYQPIKSFPGVSWYHIYGVCLITHVVQADCTILY